MKRRLLLTWGTLLGLLAFVLILGSADTAFAGTFSPSVNFCFDDPSTADINPTKPGDPGECDGDNSAGAPTYSMAGFSLPKGDAQFAGVVTYIPNEFSITPGAEFPIGTRVGRLEAISVIGLINNQCDNVLNLIGTAGFELYNSSLDINDTLEFEEESGGEDPEREDWAEDLDGNTLIEAIDKYPTFVNRVIDDEDGNPQQPLRRSAGRIIISGQDVLIQFLIFEPGTFIDKHLTNDAALGYPSVTLLQNAGDPDILWEPEPVTDYCTPLEAATATFGIGDACDSVVNDDLEDDDLINDGCPTLGIHETPEQCADDKDDDNDGLVNDGCPADGDPELPEQCDNSEDDDNDGAVNDGCPMDESAESGEQCDNNEDDDSDGSINDGCPADGDPELPENCGYNDEDDDDDGVVNDGCPVRGYPETPDQCSNLEDDDMLDDLDFSRDAGRGEEARVNDGCAQAGDTSEDDIEYVLVRNPSEEGTYTGTVMAWGQPDTDGDGIDNTLDTCPLITNDGEDPRIKGEGDLDEDGLDKACDPDDNELNSDQDNDGYVNRQDNCPLISNGDQGTNQHESDVDEDGEDEWDRIGDECDEDPDVFNGEPFAERLQTLEVDIEIGPAGQETPTDGETPTPSEEDGGGGTTVVIIVVVVAAVVIIGGGGLYLMRRRGA